MPKKVATFRLFVAGGLGPVSETEGVSLFGRWLEPGLAAALSGRVKRIYLGPVLSVSALFNSLKLKHFDAATKDLVVNNWNLKGGLGMVVSVPVSEGCRVGLEADLEALLFRYHYQETRLRQEIIVSPTLAWKTMATAVFYFPSKRP